ncbi:hypothetical protein L198_01745 [Cryptococcus wingfieldii CBS 7118]|uniref:Uncharacterized protein n=1 Tax=Cryptococcus wingfieldii CBS 7118 TaxID=1295528 RepID=A0A1E3K2S9_9TREE|nr:hypothetical protein L198_01745 [Cryptococcus wingfieldii CBS 7118]ODO06512.1 hypothetical protein L198_01745 [Cryptococcus wingfieldii CBS 7118]
MQTPSSSSTPATGANERNGVHKKQVFTVPQHAIIDQKLFDVLMDIKNDFDQGLIESIIPEIPEDKKGKQPMKDHRPLEKRALEDEKVAKIGVNAPSYWENRFQQLKRDWYTPIANVAGESGREFKDGKLQISEEEWEGLISTNKRYKRLKEQPFHHFDAMKYILKNHTTTGNLAGPIHRSRPPNRSTSPPSDSPSSHRQLSTSSRHSLPPMSFAQASARRHAPVISLEADNVSRKTKGVVERERN